MRKWMIMNAIGMCLLGSMTACATDSDPVVDDEQVTVPDALNAQANDLTITAAGAIANTTCIAVAGYDCNQIDYVGGPAEADRNCMSKCGNRPMHCTLRYRPGAPAACKTAGRDGGDGLSYCLEISICPVQCFTGTCETGYRP